MADQRTTGPDETAVRVALWRALHVLADAPPHVIDDEVGLRLAAPGDGWRDRPDMDPSATSRFRGSIVARARFVEDLVVELGVSQYVILGAGLDTFAQRRPEIAAGMRVFEVDQPGTQAWKRHRLTELGLGVPDWLRLVPVDFEADDAWAAELPAAGFDPHRPALVAATGVSMYLTREAIVATLRQAATLPAGSTLAMTFLLPAELAEPGEREQHRAVQRSARTSGTPFRSFFSPPEMLDLAREAGFAQAGYVSGGDLAARYFACRTDGLRPGSAEAFLVATTGPG